MRSACLIALLVLAAPLCAEEKALTLAEAKALLAKPSVAQRSEGIAALGAIGSREALETLLPLLEDRSLMGGRYTQSPVAAAFVLAKNPAIAISVLDGALLRPDIAVGGTWMFTRGRLDHEPSDMSSGGYGGPFPGPPLFEPAVLSDAKLTKLLNRLAAALPVKHAAVVEPALALFVAFGHRSPHIPPAAARAWSYLHEDARVALLGDEGWPLIRSEVVAAVLPSTPDTKQGAYWYGGHARSLALKRMLEMGSKAARAEILADMRRPSPHLSRDALLALPDKALPELEPVWRANLAVRVHRDTSRIANLAGRYASGKLLDTILRLYRTSEGWACDCQSAMLRYILKHDRATGIAEVTKALARRGKGRTGCYRDLLQEVLPAHWSAAAEALALETLGDKELAVRMSAALALVAAGSTKSAEPVLALLHELSAEDPSGGPLRYKLLFAIAKRDAWMADTSIKKAFCDPLSEGDLGTIRMSAPK